MNLKVLKVPEIEQKVRVFLLRILPDVVDFFLFLFRFVWVTRVSSQLQVLDATSDEPWGPHGSDLADIARATKR